MLDPNQRPPIDWADDLQTADYLAEWQNPSRGTDEGERLTWGDCVPSRWCPDEVVSYVVDVLQP